MNLSSAFAWSENEWRAHLFPLKREGSLRFAVADQREMSHRRHRPTLGEADAAVPRGPFSAPM
jgi:hypothetical protein